MKVVLLHRLEVDECVAYLHYQNKKKFQAKGLPELELTPPLTMCLTDIEVEGYGNGELDLPDLWDTFTTDAFSQNVLAVIESSQRKGEECTIVSRLLRQKLSNYFHPSFNVSNLSL
ncbi:hypothetical protein EGR_07097 [Echinococcus granulosus]|uniref:Uncharacterized protein n=1 Tax=Echinococcus granulosus TaxID=6210 RepID=W6UIW4_ECHGR|nr:hypothetical protein EGR_07097 [Echinococcus granulosus]EUB58077.1 hypothetical protein EGR_07097 [Echinococcus granulosus]